MSLRKDFLTNPIDELVQIELGSKTLFGRIQTEPFRRSLLTVLDGDDLPDCLDSLLCRTKGSELRCFWLRRVNDVRNSNGYSESVFSSTLIVEGPLASKISPITQLDAIRLRLPSLSGWNPRLYSINLSDIRSPIAKIEPNYKVTYDTLLGRLSFVSYLERSYSRDRFSISQDDYLELCLTRPVTINKIVGQFDSILYLMYLTEGAPQVPSSISLVSEAKASGSEGDKRESSLFVPLVHRPNSQNSPLFERPTSLLENGSSFQHLLHLWDECFDQLSPQIRVLYNAFYSEYPLDARFVYLTGVLETYDKIRNGQKDKSFRTRIQRLIQQELDVIPFNIANVTDLSTRLKEIRNAIAHVGPDYRSQVGGDVFDHLVFCFILVEALLFRELRLSADLVRAILRQRAERYQVSI